MTDVTGLTPVMSTADSHDSTSHLLPAKVELLHTRIHQNTGVGYYASQRPEPVYIAGVLCASCLANLPQIGSLESHPGSPAEPAKGGQRGLPAETLKLIVTGLFLEELLISRIRFIFFSNWGGYLYRARFYPSCFSDFKFEGDRRYSHRVHEYRGATGWLQGDMAELAPTWRLRGCHAGRREVDDDPAANGRRAAAASGGANHGDTGKSEHTGRLFVMRGDEPTARIRRRELDGGESQRRQPAGREEGNGDEATRGRFPAVRASTRLRELDASVGLDGATPSEAGDERVLWSSSGDGGEHAASDDNGRGGAG
ncbi:B1143G03.6 [Oryza sativa (japonica cultivar-group)]